MQRTLECWELLYVSLGLERGACGWLECSDLCCRKLHQFFATGFHVFQLYFYFIFCLLFCLVFCFYILSQNLLVFLPNFQVFFIFFYIVFNFYSTFILYFLLRASNLLKRSFVRYLRLCMCARVNFRLHVAVCNLSQSILVLRIAFSITFFFLLYALKDFYI